MWPERSDRTMWWLPCFVLTFLVVSSEADKRPHIIFILADDLGWNDVGFHGNDFVPTPNIDALAYSGVILNSHYVTPFCSPTRACLMTARHQSKTGMWERVMNATQPYGVALDEKFLPEYLKDFGYATHMVGKWHLGSHKKDYLPTYRGFDSHFGNWHSRIDYWTHRHHAQGCNVGLDMHDGEFPTLEGRGTYATRLYTKKSQEVITNHDKKEPLFLFISHTAVHIPNHCTGLQAPKATIAEITGEATEARKIFAAMISELDQSVGAIMESLRDNDMLNNTIVVFSTDNGGAVGAFPINEGNNWPLRGGKGTFFEGGTKGTSFIWSPLLKNVPRVSKQIMHIQDWVPTLLGSFNAKPITSKYPLDGVNGWPALNDPNEIIRNEFLYIMDNIDNFSALRYENWKMTVGTSTYGMVEKWYKTSERFGAYNLPAVKSSKAAVAIKDTITPLPDNGEIMKLREQATVNCPELTGPACNTSFSCLFDLSTDPCERVNLYDSQKNVRDILEKKIAEEVTNLAPSRKEKSDPLSFPSNWNNMWVAYQDLDVAYNS